VEQRERTVEVSTKYVTTVADLPEAWEFIMDRLDQVGPDPHVVISPVWTKPWEEIKPSTEHQHESVGDWPRHFEVVVEGTVEEDKS